MKLRTAPSPPEAGMIATSPCGILKPTIARYNCCANNSAGTADNRDTARYVRKIAQPLNLHCNCAADANFKEACGAIDADTS